LLRFRSIVWMLWAQFQYGLSGFSVKVVRHNFGEYFVAGCGKVPASELPVGIQRAGERPVCPRFSLSPVFSLEFEEFLQGALNKLVRFPSFQ
jgi:hypothetical protein